MIEETLNALRAAIETNTAALREVLAAGGAPTNVVPITEAPKPAKKQKVEKPSVVEPTTLDHEEIQRGILDMCRNPQHVVEPEPMLSEAAEKIIKDASDKITAEKVAIVNAAAEKIVSERCTVTEEPTRLNPVLLITQISDAWKAQLTAADPERKVMLKDKFPELRAKWGLAPDDKLITLIPTPEKLAGLLADITEL
jgi:hypothetical protein